MAEEIALYDEDGQAASGGVPGKSGRAKKE
jgi:hypothetical protein